MRYTWASATHVGLIRAGNEDSVRPMNDGSSENPVVIAVADGMGGAVANDSVIEAISNDYTLSGMGTTLTLGLFEPAGSLRVGHIGDSRMYLYREGDLTQLTRDHTLVAELVAMGQITEEQAETHPRRHLVTRVIGTETVDVDEFDVELSPGDRVLLFSDWLNSMLRDTRIAEILRKADSPSDAAWKLVEAANAAGGNDNTTVAVVDVSP